MKEVRLGKESSKEVGKKSEKRRKDKASASALQVRGKG